MEQYFEIAGFAALLVAIFIPIDAILLILWPRPSTAIDYFALLQSNVLLGLLSLDLLYVVDQVLMIPVLIALYIKLKHTNESIITLSSILGIIGINAIFASNTAANMLHLSNQYALATADGQRSLFLAAGEAMLSGVTGSSYHVHIILGAVSFVVISIFMLQDKTFRKTTAYSGILANLLTLGLYIPVIGFLILLVSLIFFEIWVILLARRFLQQGSGHP